MLKHFLNKYGNNNENNNNFCVINLFARLIILKEKLLNFNFKKIVNLKHLGGGLSLNRQFKSF
jgi:hypothetical protein